jgi:NDP-sugar pyrophosphorylase family protein
LAGPRFLFSGIYLVNAEFIARIPAATKISVIPIFCEMIRAHAKLGGVIIDEGRWRDLGNREHYLVVHQELAAQQSAPWIHPTAKIAPTATISGATAIGAGTRVGEHASLHDSLVWEGAEIASGTLLNHCIVTDGQRVEGIHSHVDF